MLCCRAYIGCHKWSFATHFVIFHVHESRHETFDLAIVKVLVWTTPIESDATERRPKLFNFVPRVRHLVFNLEEHLFEVLLRIGIGANFLRFHGYIHMRTLVFREETGCSIFKTLY